MYFQPRAKTSFPYFAHVGALTSVTGSVVSRPFSASDPPFHQPSWFHDRAARDVPTPGLQRMSMWQRLTTREALLWPVVPCGLATLACLLQVATIVDTVVQFSDYSDHAPVCMGRLQRSAS
jgi:hypothetical protein